MNTSPLASASACLLLLLATGCASPPDHAHEGYTRARAVEASSARETTAARWSPSMLDGWPERPRFAAAAMIDKYGSPQGVTPDAIFWHDQGPYKRIMVTREEIPHDFPLPHMDFLEHTIAYDVPAEKASEVIAFDGSVTINRTAGEVSARCDLEGHNILTLNLVNDIVIGKKTAAEARRAFGEAVTADVKGEHPAYVEKLLFQPTGARARFADEPVIPGSPKRAATSEVSSTTKTADAEILATVLAIDMNEVLAAAEAQKKNVSDRVKEYARMLHEEHGQHMETTMKLGQAIGVTPLSTPQVDALQRQGADGLAMLLTLEDSAFEEAYVAAMVKGHEEALAVLGTKTPMARDARLKQHLEQTRTMVAAHLEKARTLQQRR